MSIFISATKLSFKWTLLMLVFVPKLYCQSICITDKYSLDKEEVISNLLSLQQTWQINIRENQPKETCQKGFLFVKMRPEFLLDLLNNKNGLIIWTTNDEGLTGYIILTEIDEFFDLYVNSPIRTFACTTNQAMFEEYIQANHVKYIEQIAVNRNITQIGVGTTLMNEAKRISPNGLVAAVLTEPVSNQASLSFFTKNGFQTMGHLNCVECSEWPAYQTCVLCWQPN